jgi:hypothetical protein
MGTILRLVWVIALLGSVLVIFCGGETSVQGPVGHIEREAAPAEGGMWHLVQDGENLRQISKRYYGNSNQWRAIQLTNDVSSYPEEGYRLWIPATIDGWFADREFEATLMTEVRLDDPNTPRSGRNADR